MPARNEHVFLVRMWSEGRQGDASAWRGSVRHVSSGRTLFIAAPAEVGDFISARLSEPELPVSHEDDEPESAP
jgi:hypothetical protein